MSLLLRLIQVSVVFFSRAAAMALAPSGPMQLPQRLIEVSVVFFKRLSKSYSALITYMTGGKIN